MHRPRRSRRRAGPSTPPLAQALEPRRLLSAFLLKDVNTTPPIEQQPSPAGFMDAGGTLLFAALDGTNRVLYGSDGTPEGTAPLHSVRPEINFTTGLGTVAIGGVAFFAGMTPDGGTELWKSDGTAAGTVRVKDINPGVTSSTPAHLTNVDGTLYFTAVHPDSGRELWKSDGTEAGTVLVSDTLPGPTGRGVWEIEPADGTVYFATRGDVTEPGILWKTRKTRSR